MTSVTTSPTVSEMLRRAVVSPVPLLRAALLSGAGAERTKADGSVATETDDRSDRQLLAMLRQLDLPVWVEESGWTGEYDPNGRFVAGDPCDGTAAERLGIPTSTVGACVFNGRTRQFEGAAVADLFGRVWYTEGDQTYRYFAGGFELPASTSGPLKVSGRSLSEGEVLIDVDHGFNRTDTFTGEERPVLTTKDVQALKRKLNESGIKTRSFSSNLLHQAMVADGNVAVASIMTAVGGFQDLSGVQLVLNAGGVVCYLRRDEEGDFDNVEDSRLADLVITANHRDTMANLRLFSLASLAISF